MFSLRNFILNGLISAIGRLEDYQIILNAAAWYEKGVLTEEDLADIQVAIDAKNAPVEEDDSIFEDYEEEEVI